MPYTNKQKKTLRAIRSAFKSPTLAQAGGCEYVSDHGKRCIVGTVLHNYGVPDDILKRGTPVYDFDYNPNESFFRTQRTDLHEFVKEKGLSIDLLSTAQDAFDGFRRLKPSREVAAEKVIESVKNAIEVGVGR